MNGALKIKLPDGSWVIIPQAGPPGPPGSASDTFTFVQSTPSVTWVIDHGLGYTPNVAVVDSAGHQVEGDVAYSFGQVIVSFSAAFSGTAYLS